MAALGIISELDPKPHLYPETKTQVQKYNREHFHFLEFSQKGEKLNTRKNQVVESRSR